MEKVEDDFVGWVVVTRMGQWLGRTGYMIRKGRVTMGPSGPIAHLSPVSLRKATAKEIAKKEGTEQ